MKKIFVSIILLAAILCMSVSPVFATEPEPTVVQYEDGSTVVYFDDGSTLTYSPVKVIEEQVSPYVTVQTKNAYKEAKFTNTNGTVEWVYTLTASFTYVEGLSCKCTSATYTKTIYDNNWTFSNGSATFNDRTAYGKGHFTKKLLGITVKNYDIDITIKCDTYGVTT